MLWLGESEKRNHQMRAVVVFFPDQKYPSHGGWKRKKKCKKKKSVCFYSGSWGELSRVLGCFIDIQECHLSKITTSSSLEVGSFSPLNHLTGFCQRGVNFNPLSSPSSHSLAMIITIISAPSSFQMMDILAPHLGLPRPGELASVCHSFMACPFCTDSWTQQTPEWAVLFILFSYLSGLLLLPGMPFFPRLSPPFHPHHPLRTSDTSSRKLSLTASHPTPSPAHMPSSRFPSEYL